jgi:hypothetical protein
MAATRRSAVLFVLIGAAVAAFGQSDPRNVPAPPVAELAKFRPYLGMYEQTMDWRGLAFSGTIEIKAAVKGWYVEWIINTHHQQAIDRENRLIMTWDRNLKKYRIWRFETLDPLPPEGTEGEVRFSGEELIMEWKGPKDPVRGMDVKFYRNRVRFTGKDEFEIVTELEPKEGELRKLGVTRAKRRL